MASALLKKSLDLFKDDLEEEDTRKKKKVKNPMKLLGTNKKGLKQQRRKIKRRLEEESKAKLRKQKTAQDDLHHSKASDQLQSNLQILHRMDKMETVQRKTVDKILEHQKGKLSRNKPTEEIQPQVDKSILFNDRAFDGDEKETDLDS